MEMTFLELFRRYIAYHQNTTNFFDKRKSVTVKAYSNKYTLVNDFLYSENKVKIKAIDFTISVARRLITELSTTYSHNYSVRIIELCRAVLKYGTSHEFIKYNPLSSLTMQKTAPNKLVYLTNEEIVLIEDHEPITTMIEKAKDMFLFMCFTGLDYGDLITVNHENIVEYKENLFIVKKRNKTSVEAFIPYTEKARKLFTKHDYNMKLLSNPRFNEALKDLAIDCGIDKHLTTHIGRKTYAMIMLNHKRYSMGAVSKILGHKSVKTTETHYAQVGIELVNSEFKEKN